MRIAAFGPRMSVGLMSLLFLALGITPISARAALIFLPGGECTTLAPFGAHHTATSRDGCGGLGPFPGMPTNITVGQDAFALVHVQSEMNVLAGHPYPVGTRFTFYIDTWTSFCSGVQVLYEAVVVTSSPEYVIQILPLGGYCELWDTSNPSCGEWP